MTVGTSQQRAKRSPQPPAAGGSLLSVDNGEGALSSADRENPRRDVTDGAETKREFTGEHSVVNQWELGCPAVVNQLELGCPAVGNQLALERSCHPVRSELATLRLPADI